MAGKKKDHYVARTYLKNFSSTTTPGLVNVIRKSNLQRLNKIHVGDICHKKDWSTNEYFVGKERIVEKYLEVYEPKWTACVNLLRGRGFDFETKANMAGYIAYLGACTPTAARIAQISTEESAQLAYDVVERRERKKVSAELQEKIAEFAEKHGTPKAVVNDQLPKAMGIQGLPKMQERLLDFRWVILRNETGIPFITSDNPVCRNYENGRGTCDLYCPITPEIAVLIESSHEQQEEHDALGLISLDGVRLFNELMVKSAEDMVIFGEGDDVETLVKKYQDWQVGLMIIKLPEEKGWTLITQQKAMKQTSNC